MGGQGSVDDAGGQQWTDKAKHRYRDDDQQQQRRSLPVGRERAHHAAHRGRRWLM